MDILKNLQDYEKKIEDETKKNHHSELQLLESAFEHFCLGFTKFKKQKIDKLTLVRIGLLASNLDSFQVTLIATRKGYYLQALSLVRNIYENWLAFWYLIQNQGEVDKWLNPSWGMRPPTADVMRRNMKHPSKDSSKKIHDLATELHRFSHTDPAVILDHLSDNENQLDVRIGQKYHSGKFEACVYSISFWLGMNLDALESLIASDQEWIGIHNNLKDQIEKFLVSYNKEIDKKNI